MTGPPLTTTHEELRLKFLALSEVSRLKMLYFLNLSPDALTVTDIALYMNMRPSVASKHLKILGRAGFVKSVQLSRFVVHRLNSDSFLDLAQVLVTFSGDPNAKVVRSQNDPVEDTTRGEERRRKDGVVDDVGTSTPTD